MTDDLKQRLRALAEEWHECCGDIHVPLLEAADRIEYLEAKEETWEDGYRAGENKWAEVADQQAARIEALETALAGDGWQPIASAPRDGAEILLLAHGMCIQAHFSPGRWSVGTPISVYDGPVWCAFDDAVQFEIEEMPDVYWDGPVTHWRPLPAPPEGEGM